MTQHCFPVQIFSKGSVHAVVRLGKSTFKTRAVRAAPTVAWEQTGYLFVRCANVVCTLFNADLPVDAVTAVVGLLLMKPAAD